VGDGEIWCLLLGGDRCDEVRRGAKIFLVNGPSLLLVVLFWVAGVPLVVEMEFLEVEILSVAFSRRCLGLSPPWMYLAGC